MVIGADTLQIARVICPAVSFRYDVIDTGARSDNALALAWLTQPLIALDHDISELAPFRPVPALLSRLTSSVSLPS